MTAKGRGRKPAAAATPEEAFLQAIHANITDPTPWQMYADWLEERGDPRGEFIRVQCQLAHMPRGASPWQRLWQRERQLYKEHGARWAGPIAGRGQRGALPFRLGLLRPELSREAAAAVVQEQGYRALARIVSGVSDS